MVVFSQLVWRASLIGPGSVTERASDDQSLKSSDDIIFAAKFPRVRNQPNHSPHYLAGCFLFQ